MGLSRMLLIFLLTASTLGWSQSTNRYFVFFKDKSASPYSVSQPEKFLSPKSIQRRALHKIVITSEDFPVNPTYVQQVKSTGAKTFFTSRWWNGVLVEANDTQLLQIKNLPSVAKVDLVASGIKLQGGRTRETKQRNETSSTEAVNEVQLQMIGLDEMQSEGFQGDGVSIAIFDSGFIGVNESAPFQHLFAEARIKSTFNFVHNITDVYNYDSHGTEVFSIMAASSASYTGGIFKANFHLFKTEDTPTEFRIEEYNWTFAAERADSLGIDVINSSLG
jgi:Subtilase family.